LVSVIAVSGCTSYQSHTPGTASQGPGQPPAASPTTAKPIAQPPGSLSCRTYGCVGDGTSDDTVPIRNMIQDACNEGGETLYLPSGTYRIQPQNPGENALTIACSNITLMGAGQTFTTLSSYLEGGGLPNNSCPIISTSTGSKVWRGSGVVIRGGITADETVHDVTVEDLTLDGHARQTGDSTWPSTSADCFNWDITHKGILVTADRYVDKITISNTHITGFLGELIYQGGEWGTNILITGNEIDTTNADGISVSAGMSATDNNIHDIGHAGFEDEIENSSQTISGNSISSVGVSGIDLVSNEHAGASVGFVVTGNTITNALVRGIGGIPVQNLSLSNNSFVDSGQKLAAIYLENPTTASTIVTRNVQISGNSILSQKAPVNAAIIFVSGNGGPILSPWTVDLSVVNNVMEESVSSGGKIKATLVHCTYPGSIDQGLTVSGNYIVETP
jgi:Pectate lyase superfamily protein